MEFYSEFDVLKIMDLSTAAIAIYCLIDNRKIVHCRKFKDRLDTFDARLHHYNDAYSIVVLRLCCGSKNEGMSFNQTTPQGPKLVREKEAIQRIPES